MNSKKRVAIYLLLFVSIISMVAVFNMHGFAVEPCSNYLRFVDTGCVCSETIDPGCEGFYMTGYCDNTTGTACTTNVSCVIIYPSPCNGKSQESCDPAL